MDDLPDWLNDLRDEYPTKRSPEAQARLFRIFRHYDTDTMQAAVDRYMLEQRYFPKVGDLKPYVDVAAEDARGKSYQAIFDGQVIYGRWASETGKFYSDDVIHAWEVARGTMAAIARGSSDV